MKKIVFTMAVGALFSSGIMAQGNKVKPAKRNFTKANKQIAEEDYSKPNLSTGQLPKRGCGTKTPSRQWDEAFNKMVETHKANLAISRTTSTTYTIPIIFHIIHSSSEAVGVGHNVSQVQVNSQIPILNADYNGTGVNTNLYAGMTLSGNPAFYDYAQSAGLLAPDNNGVVIASSGITFCLASKNPSGTTLSEPGIDRVAYQSITGSHNPATSPDVQTLFDDTIKPATIWDPTKYFNVWVSDGGVSGLLGYATFPPASGSSLSAITPNWGESNSSTPTSADGVWMSYQALGNTGAAASPYNLGRTLTHESGHWLGLRHIWGDGSCVTDYCNDTPPAGQANFVPGGTSYPYQPNSCSGTPSNGNGPDGDMFMDFMDYSDDAAMWMFTTDQVNRFYAALSLSPLRSGLTASAASLGAGIESNAHLGSNINLFPNPNNGQFSFAITLSEPTNLNFIVVNMLGQVVYTKTENNISNAVLNCDLSNLAKGIYYANIMDSNNNKTIKKIIIQ